MGDIANGWLKSPLPAGDARHILLQTKLFALGDMPPKRQVQAFNDIFEQPDVAATFRYISERAEPAGRLYAFAALSMLAPPEAAALRETLVQVATRSFCTIPMSSTVNLFRLSYCSSSGVGSALNAES